MEIEKLASDDLPQLGRLLEELSGMRTAPEKAQAVFLKIDRDEDYILLGARIDEELAGTVMGIVCHDLVGECRPFLVLENFIVAERFRRQGIGHRLLESMETIGRQRQCTYTMFVSGGQRSAAHRFYESAGYRPDEVRGFKKRL